MSTNDGPRSPFSFQQDEAFVGEGAMLRTRRRRIVTAIVVIAILVLAFGGLQLQKWQWSRSLDPAVNAQTGLADGAYSLDVTQSYRGDGDCWFGGPVRGVPSAGDVLLYGTGEAQCARSGDYVGHVLFTVDAGRATITRVRGY